MGYTNQTNFTITIVVLSLLGIMAITILIVLLSTRDINESINKYNKRYYKGQAMRLASKRRKWNSSTPRIWTIAPFSKILPGSASVIHGDTNLITTHDIRPYISRGDPIKVGAQLFLIDKDTSRAFTETMVPLEPSLQWRDHNGKLYDSPGRLIGPSAQNITLFTYEMASLPKNKWKGPRGGAIGYWDKTGKWIDGTCFGKCIRKCSSYWYSPLWIGANGVQYNGPYQSRSNDDDVKEEEEEEEDYKDDE